MRCAPYVASLFAGLGLTLLASPALAADGTVTVQKQGIMPTWAWVDGQPIGKIKKRKPVTKPLSAGWHEVWYAGDPDGIVTMCHGLVNVPAGGDVSTLYRDRGCEGLTAGWPSGPSAFKGAEVAFRIDSALEAWVSIDGSQPYAFPDMPFSLNLAPGQHTFVIYNDVMQESVFDQGTVTLQPGQTLPVQCTTAGCVGFDAPPVFIVELREAPAIQVATPGVSIDFNMGVNVDGQGAGMSMSVDDGQGGGASVQVGASAGGAGAGMSIDVDDGTGGGNVDVSVDVEVRE